MHCSFRAIPTHTITGQVFWKDNSGGQSMENISKVVYEGDDWTTATYPMNKDGYTRIHFKVDGSSKGNSVTKWTFSNVKADHDFEVRYEKN